MAQTREPSAELVEALMPCVKRGCGITWSDENTDAEVADKIESAWAWLEDKLGAMGDEAYLVPGNRRTLLKERVRYDRAGALDVWANNYRDMILAEQHKIRIDRRVADNARAQESV